MKENTSTYSFQATWQFSNDFPTPRRHPVAFGARAPENSENVYYNLQFWLFLRHFLIFSGLVIFSPETFLGKPTWYVRLCGCLAPFVLPWKPSKHPICSFLVKPKTVSKWTKRHPHIRSKPHDNFPMTSQPLEFIPWRSELGPRKSPKACIITLNFGCFWDIFLFFQAWSYFLPKSS